MLSPRLSLRSALVIALAPAAGLLIAFVAFGAIGAAPAAAVAAALASGVLWWWRWSARLETTKPKSRDHAAPSVNQDFLEALPDPVILLNGAREVIAINRPAHDVFGIGMLGRDLALSLRHPDVLAAVETLTAGVASVSEEITLPMPLPRTFTLHAAVLSKTSDPAAPHIVLVLHDETRAKRAEQSRADFVANASHELRSPLAALIGFIETLRGAAKDDAEATDRFLGVMQNEALRMARLVDDLMSLSRVEINEHIPPRSAVDLGKVLAAVADALAVRAEGRDMTIVVDISQDLSVVAGDADQLTQVFHNLIDNAIKYGRAGTAIRVTAKAVDRLPSGNIAGVSVAVSDEGDGIAPIHIPRLTERFYRADGGRSRRLGGTGLGLAIVKHIVNRHRGQLTIESRQGIGSTFTVFLPALAAATGARSLKEPTKAARQGGLS